MKKYLCHIFTVSMVLMSLTASAQEKQDLRQVYTKAEEAYQIGQLDQAIELLSKRPATGFHLLSCTR